MGSVSGVITLGLFGGPVVTLGLGSSTAVVVPGPFRSVAGQAYAAGSKQGEAYQPGSQLGQHNQAGSVQSEAY